MPSLLINVLLCMIAGMVGAQFWYKGLSEGRTDWLALIVLLLIGALAYAVATL